jgi:hypothetical protein
MHELRVDYGAGGWNEGRGLPPPGNLFYVHPRTCAHQRYRKIQTLGQVGLQCEFKYFGDSGSNGW